jgi:hypothetical protein
MRIRSRSRTYAAVATLVAALLLPRPARARDARDEGEREAKAVNPVVAGFDLVIVRPLGLGAVVVGAVLFLPMALISAPQGRDGLRHSWELLVGVPVENVFQRPLGDF